MALMAAERIERPPMLFGPGLEIETEEAHGVGGGLTLDEVIVGVWEGLAAHAAVACPLCAGTLRPRTASGAAAGGRCGDCGTTLV